jgi:hypothetical protein
MAAAQAGRQQGSAWPLGLRRMKAGRARWSRREGGALGRWAGEWGGGLGGLGQLGWKRKEIIGENPKKS